VPRRFGGAGRGVASITKTVLVCCAASAAQAEA